MAAHLTFIGGFFLKTAMKIISSKNIICDTFITIAHLHFLPKNRERNQQIVKRNWRQKYSHKTINVGFKKNVIKERKIAFDLIQAANRFFEWNQIQVFLRIFPIKARQHFANLSKLNYQHFFNSTQVQKSVHTQSCVVVERRFQSGSFVGKDSPGNATVL